MAKTTIFVLHDIHGEIIAIGRPMGDANVTPISGDEQAVLQTVVEEEEIASLPHTHLVDAARKTLISRDIERQAEGA